MGYRYIQQPHMKTYDPARLAWRDDVRAAVPSLGLAVILLLLVAAVYWLRSQLEADTNHQLPAVSATPAAPAPHSAASADVLPSMDEPRPDRRR